MFAAWFGMVAGVAELLVVAFRKFIRHRFVLFDVQIVWMTPLSYVLLLGLFGVGVAVAARFAPPRFGRPASVFIPALVASFGVLFLYHPSLHRIAIVVLALGVAVQVTRALLLRLEAFRVFARRSLAAGLAVLTLAAAGLNGGAWLAERRALAAIPAATAERPNIVLIVLDTVRSISMSLYGHTRPTTPFLERLARRGVLFANAFSTSPWTLPSHAGIFTGRFPREQSAGWTTPLDDTHPTLAGTLRDHGYATAGFVANREYAAAETGLDRGFVHYADHPVSPAEVLISSSLGRFIANNPRLRATIGYHDILGRKTAEDINREFLGWLDHLNRRPYFAFLNYYDAHEPYLPPPELEAAFGNGVDRDLSLIRHVTARMAERAFKAAMSPAEREAEQRAYEASLAYLDGQLERLFAALAARGDLENTVVIVTADHGELFGEHDLFTHGNSLYVPLLHVPLLIAYDGRSVPAGLTVHDPVTLRDLAATVLDVAGIGSDHGIPGASLARRWREGTGAGTTASPIFAEVEPAPNQRSWYPSSKGAMTSLVHWPYHYIRHHDGREEFFDIAREYGETADRAAGPAARSALDRARVLVDSITGEGTRGADR